MAGGLWAAWLLAVLFVDYFQAQSWVETPARITSIDLNAQRGDDSTSYTVVAQYRYEFDGKDYTGDRVTLATKLEGNDYNRRMHRELKRQFEKRQPTSCFVNPDRPERAVLDRQLRLRAVLFLLPFAICFTLAGVFIVGGAHYANRRELRRTTRQSKHPDEPWRVRADWEAGEIRTSTQTTLLAPAFFALFWNGLSVPVFCIVLLDKGSEWWVVALVGVFPLVGLFLFGSFVHQLLRYSRFGSSTFRMASVPGVVGGELAGVVLAPAGIRADDGFLTKLACLITVIRRDSDGDPQTSLRTVWQDERLVERTLHDPSGQRGVPIRFAIPSEARETSRDETERPVVWRLIVEARQTGPDYVAEFEVPVFLTEDSQDGVEATSEPLTPYERQMALPEALAREGIRVSQGPADGLPAGALQIVCPPGRNFTSGSFLLLIGLLFAAVAIACGFYLDAWITWILMLILGPLGLLMVYGGLDILLSCIEVLIDGDQWRVRSGWAGWYVRDMTFNVADIRSLFTKHGMTSSSGDRPSRVWNHIQARLVGNRKVTLVRDLANRHTEALLLAELHRRANLPTSGVTPEEPTA